MPRIRLLADLADAQASGVAAYDDTGNPVFNVPPGDVVELVYDATGWAAGDTLADSTWEAPDGGTISARSLSGKVVSCHVYVPDTNSTLGWRMYRVRNTLSTTGGLIRRTLVWLRATRF